MNLRRFCCEGERMKERNKFYEQPRWRDLQDRILRRDGYQCKISSRYGRMISAQLVHHIFPLREFPEYAYAEWNLISLCWKEHNKLHDRDTDELTEKGRELLIRTAKKNNIPIPEKYSHPIKARRGNGRPSTI